MFHKLLIANRGEIAVRVLRAAQDLGLATVAVHSADDAQAPHVAMAGEAVALAGSGPAPYLDIAALVRIARERGCDAVHPGYGFLSERADFAQALADAGITFVGPPPGQLALFGDKARACAFAREHGVPVLAGTGAATLAELQAFFATQPAGIVIKAVAGGGGRGMRAVQRADDLPAAFERCQAEALAAFGSAAVYGEPLIARARHLEVQVLGDGQAVVALGERECTLQRRWQKLVEMAPSPALSDAQRQSLTDAALRLARAAAYQGLGTFEFLLDAAGRLVFIEANPRLQVEHTVTEMVTGVDLVQAQLRLAAGRTLAELGLTTAPAPRGCAIQWRISAETLDASGLARPAEGVVSALHWPDGPGLRVDHQARVGHAPSPHHDPLLAKLVVHGEDFAAALRRSRRALAECRIDGLGTNLDLLRAVAAHPDVAAQQVHTRWLEAHLAELLPVDGAATSTGDPHTLVAPMSGRLVALAEPGATLAAGADAAVLEAMKMQHGLAAPRAVRVLARLAEPGVTVREGQPLLRWVDADTAGTTVTATVHADPDAIRPDLQRVLDRWAGVADAARPEAMARRHAAGGRSARENLADLADDGSFVEYGAFAFAAQTRRRPVDELIRQTPADGLVAGLATVNAAQFGPERARCLLMAYDYTVLAGTQGFRNHHKKDRLLELALRLKLPTVLYAEGGGGRPGDVDMPIVAGLNNHTFSQFAALSGQVPVVGVVHGRCFAGNAALLGCCDVVIATRNANIGLGGPAMIEGGGLGVFPPEAIGPAPELARVGVVDLLVDDEAAATEAARRYLGYFQGALPPGEAADARALRQAVPEDRLRAYDMRALIATLFDTGSVLELRRGFGAGMVTALARLAGRPVAVLANNPHHLGGAIDAEAATKAARFLQLAQAHGLPVVTLCDTPGFMVGPDAERQAQVRHACRLFVTAAKLTVPCFTVVVRKGYGLGAQAMAVGGFEAPVFTVAWPTGEFGAMGLEGAVRLGFRKELDAAAPGADREALHARLVAQQYERGSALNMAATLEIDAVIDPADTRHWLLRGLESAGPIEGGGRGFVDPW